jgi:serine phosphatase RsbU (regulator of sigma subunit)
MSDSERHVHDLNRVLEVTRALGAERDLDRLLDLIVEAAGTLVQADRVSLFIVDAAREQLWSKVAQGSATIRIARGSGIAGSVASSGRPINIPDAYADPRFNQANDRSSGYRTRSILCMPLINHDDAVVGVLQALNQRDGRPFDAYDERLLGALCSQAAIALDTAQLLRREREHQRLERELELAHRIQQRLLPRALPILAGWRFAAWAEPCDRAGGDYHDFLPRDDGNLLTVVGDVSGHGIAAALMMSSARAFLRGLYRREAGPDAILARLNELLVQDMSADSFMTMLVCELDAVGNLRYAAAGHEPPLVYCREQDAFLTLDSTGLMLGVLDGQSYGCQTLPCLGSGDLAIFYTDGLTETADAAGVEWGHQRLQELVRIQAPAGADAVLAAVLAAVEAYRGGGAMADDISIVVAQRQ